MGDVFLEYLIKAKTSALGWAVRAGGILLVLISAFLVLILGATGIILMFFTAYLLYKIFQWTSLEFEYSFLSGELDIDKILGQSSRKRVMTINVKETEVIASVESDKIKAHRGSDMKVVDYSSGIASDKQYAIILNLNGVRTKIIIEPNKAMIMAMRDIAPSKVFLD